MSNSTALFSFSLLYEFLKFIALFCCVNCRHHLHGRLKSVISGFALVLLSLKFNSIIMDG